MGSHEPYKADNPGKTDYGGSEYGNTASGQDSGALNMDTQRLGALVSARGNDIKSPCLALKDRDCNEEDYSHYRDITPSDCRQAAEGPVDDGGKLQFICNILNGDFGCYRFDKP